MKKYIQLFEEFSGDGVMPLWARPNAPAGAIGHAAVANSYGDYMDRSQSMTNFSVGDRVRCVDSALECYGMDGEIVAFEDIGVRWRVADARVGIDAVEYRCRPECLQKI
jgi:hypothetical protein